MERLEEKIIDLVDVVAEPDPNFLAEKFSTMGLSHKLQASGESKQPEPESSFQQELEKASSESLLHDPSPGTDSKPSEPELKFQPEEEKAPTEGVDPKMQSLLETVPLDLESLVRSEVGRLIRSTIHEAIPKMMREILTQEVEKALAREIENLKKP